MVEAVLSTEAKPTWDHSAPIRPRKTHVERPLGARLLPYLDARRLPHTSFFHTRSNDVTERYPTLLLANLHHARYEMGHLVYPDNSCLDRHVFIVRDSVQLRSSHCIMETGRYTDSQVHQQARVLLCSSRVIHHHGLVDHFCANAKA